MGRTRLALAGFMLGAAGMFAVMYATQAILPELSREFDVSASQAGLTVSVVIVVLAAGGWIWGPLSDRWGRKRTLVLASALLAVPTLAAGAGADASTCCSPAARCRACACPGC